MTYQPIRATGVGNFANPTPIGRHSKRPCVRCGVPRTTHPPRKNQSGEIMTVTGLCRDCRSIMTQEEILQWAS